MVEDWQAKRKTHGSRRDLSPTASQSAESKYYREAILRLNLKNGAFAVSIAAEFGDPVNVSG
jgi:hypothetical protein